MTLYLPHARHSRSIKCTATLALVVSAACGCNARLGVSEAPVGAGGSVDGGFVLAGSGGESGAMTYPVDAGTTMPTSCGDDRMNGTETDINCGGLDCPPCGVEFRCERHADCVSGICRAGQCAAPSCDDGVQNGDETGLDCGGSCLRCRTNSCNCAISEALTAINCDESEGYLGDSYIAFLTPDGNAALYSERYEAPVSGSGDRLFRWSAVSGLERIGSGYPAGYSDDGARALYHAANGDLLFREDPGTEMAVPLLGGSRLSGDGTQVIGTPIDGSNELLRWTPAGGVELIAALPEGEYWDVTAVTPDASAAVGWADGADGSGGSELHFRWTVSEGVTTLGSLPDDLTGLQPHGLSDDGSVVVGTAAQGLSTSRKIFRWTESTGITLMDEPALYPLGTNERPIFVSADGSRMAGTFGGERGFYWTPEGGARVLTSVWSVVKDMSRDGAIVLAAGSTSGFIWTETGVTTFADVLVERGVDLAGWGLGEPHKMTDDGSVVFGNGTCGGVPVTYRLVLTP